ncbi:MerC domain-containing protein [Sphingomonas sp. 22176]|uniref:MerC domain-containing protein n=1 Tax=Sphingomonas sp. 22176 TaxID=3453884 RepID=UPI003F83D312
MRSVRWQARLDGVGICASALCMLHCLALPLVLAALPSVAARFAPGEAFHWILLFVAIPTSALALVGGWRRHRATAPLIVGAMGLILMALGVAIPWREALETGLTMAGSLCLASAHIANWRQRGSRRRCAVPCGPAC